VDKNCKLAVKTLIEEKLQLKGSRVSYMRKPNDNKLRGRQVFLVKDLTVEKQVNQMGLLELQKFLLAIRRETKVKVQNDSINVDENWMSFNNNNMWQGKPAETKLKEIYGNSLEMSHIIYKFLSQKSKSKN